MREFDNDQRREMVNSRQRYLSCREAVERLAKYRGSMVWSATKGTDYLLHSSYRDGGAKRSQKSLGPRSPETEALKRNFESGRAAASRRHKSAKDVLDRQAAINRAIGLGRVPLTAARIIRAIDDLRLLGKGLKIAGTNALYAYEAVAGVFVDPDITTTEDIDLLFDARRELNVVTEAAVGDDGLLGILKQVDPTFERGRETFRAANDEGYLVDLIMPEPKPPWRKVRESLVGQADDLGAVGIAGLQWLQNAPAFEAIAIDERGVPLRILAVDPRIFAAHKWWLSQRIERDPLRRRRDAEQARVVARIVAHHFRHLPPTFAQMSMLPRSVFDDARPLFDPAG
jgi:hypothetical protein